MSFEYQYSDLLLRLQDLNHATESEIQSCRNMLTNWGRRFGLSRMHKAIANLTLVLKSIKEKQNSVVRVSSGDMLEINILVHLFGFTKTKVIDSDSNPVAILPGCKVIMHYFAPGDEQRRTGSIHVVPDE
jgi:hypothetical protein